MKYVLKKVWKWIRWPLSILLVGFALLVAWDVARITNSQNSLKQAADIHLQHITLADVEGKNLPPIPDEAENDATVAGIDKNNNGIRDDVELVIFKKYPTDIKVRAAELQYAMAIQLMITRVFSTETWVAAAQEHSRAYNCISKTYSRADLKTFIKITDARTKEVENLVLNNQARKDAEDNSYNFTTSYGDLEGETCDINLNTLSN